MPKVLIENLELESLIEPPFTRDEDTYEVVVSIWGVPGTGDLDTQYKIGSSADNWVFETSDAIGDCTATANQQQLIEFADEHTDCVVDKLMLHVQNRGVYVILKKLLGTGMDKFAAETPDDENYSMDENGYQVHEGFGTKTRDLIAMKNYMTHLLEVVENDIIIGTFVGYEGDPDADPPIPPVEIWRSPRPSDPHPRRVVVGLSIGKENIEKLRGLNPAEAVGEISEFDEKAGAPVVTRSEPKFRQTFQNVFEFRDLIDKVSKGLKNYHGKLSDSYFAYHVPPPGLPQGLLGPIYDSDDVEDWPELDFKQQAAYLKEAGDKIIDFLKSSGHNMGAPFEIGFRNYHKIDEEGLTTAELRDEVKTGTVPGITYVGYPIEYEKVRLYTLYVLKTPKPPPASAPALDYGLNKPPVPWPTLYPDTSPDGDPRILYGDPAAYEVDSPFDKEPFTFGTVRWFLANLRDIGYKHIGGKPTPEELKAQTEAAAVVATSEAMENPCAMSAPAMASKESMPVDDFIELYVYPNPETIFKTSSILDLAKKLAGWHSGEESAENKALERKLTKEDVLQSVVNNSHVNASDYVGDLVYKNLPVSPNKIRSIHDAYAYILRRLDIPTIIVKLLECLGLRVSLDDLIEWICDDIIKAVDEKTDGGITKLVEFLESGEFQIPGEFLAQDPPIQVTDIIGVIHAHSDIDTGSAAVDQMLNTWDRNQKLFICAAIAAGPFAAVAGLIWLINYLLTRDGSLDKQPGKKKCDIEFSFPDEWPILDALWDWILREALKRLEEEAMRLLEEEIIKPLNLLLQQLLDFCDKEEESFGEISSEDLDPDLASKAAPLFVGPKSNKFLKKLLSALTPSELCGLLRGTLLFEAPETKKITSFIYEFALDEYNGAPAGTVEHGGKPGPLGNGKNILQFFKNLGKKVNMSVCDERELPEKPISDFCDDLGVDYESNLRTALTNQGLSDEQIEGQVIAKRNAKKEIVSSAIQNLLRGSNLTEKVKEDTKKTVQKIIVEALQGTSAGAIKHVINSAAIPMTADMANFSLAFSNTSFVKRLIAGVELVKTEPIFDWLPTAELSQFHRFRFNIFDGKYLEKKALQAEFGSSAPDVNMCDEITRHIALMEDLKQEMAMDLHEARWKYWDGDLYEDLETGPGPAFITLADASIESFAEYNKARAEEVGGDPTGKDLSAYDLYQLGYDQFSGMSRFHAKEVQRKVVEASWFNLPHKNLIKRYERLTPLEFDDLAVIAFRYYSRHVHDYTNTSAGDEAELKLFSEANHYGSFYYDPLTEEGGHYAWGPLLSSVNFRMGSSRPWAESPPGPDQYPSKKPDWVDVGFYDLVSRLDRASGTDQNNYKLFTNEPRVTAVIHPHTKEVRTHLVATEDFLQRAGNWTPRNPIWSGTDVKTALVQLLLFVWDFGADELSDFPYEAGVGASINTHQGTEDGWKANFWGGHLLRALKYYQHGLNTVPSFAIDFDKSSFATVEKSVYTHPVGEPYPTYEKVVEVEKSLKEADLVDSGDTITLIEAVWGQGECGEVYRYYDYAGWTPACPSQDPETFEVIPSKTMVVNKEAWLAGNAESKLLRADPIDDSAELMVIDPETGLRAPFIPAMKPTPLSLFCAPGLKRRPPPPDPEKTWEAVYTLVPPGKGKDKEGKLKLLDEISRCITDDYTISVKEPGYGVAIFGTAPAVILDYRSKEILKLWDDIGDDTTNNEPGFSMNKTIDVLAASMGTGLGWNTYDVDEPIAPQFLEKMILRHIDDKFPHFDDQIIQDMVATGVGDFNSDFSIHYALTKVLRTHKQGRLNLYGTIFRDCIRNMANLSLKYGVAQKASGDYDSLQEKIIAAVGVLMNDLARSNALTDLTDLATDAANKHTDAMENADLADINSIPSIGKTLISYPPNPPFQLDHSYDPPMKVFEKVDWKKGPALFRLLIRVVIMEKVFKTLMTSSTYSTSGIFSSIPMKMIIASSIRSQLSTNIRDKIKILASDLGIIGEGASFSSCVLPIIEEEIEATSGKVSDLLGNTIPQLTEFLKDNVYDLATSHPECNIYSTWTDMDRYVPTQTEAALVAHHGEQDPEGYGGGLQLPDESADPTAGEKYWDAVIALNENKLGLNEIVEHQEGPKIASDNIFSLTNNFHSTLRFIDEDGIQKYSGFILEKYIKVKFKNNLIKKIEDKDQGEQFLEAWQALPIEWRGSAQDKMKPDGFKYATCLSPGEFTSAIGDFFTYFGNMTPEGWGQSVFDWAQLFDPYQFSEKLQELSDKVYEEGKQNPGDKHGHDSVLNIDRSERDLWSNGPAGQAIFSANPLTAGASAQYSDHNVVSRSAEVQRHIALMERILAYQLKNNSGGPSEGYVHPGSDPSSYYEGDEDSARPFNSPAGSRIPFGSTGVNAGWNDNTGLGIEGTAENIQSLWHSLTNQDKRDLETIAFRFYSRYYFGDLRSFYFDPHDSVYPKHAGGSNVGLKDFVGRKGFLDSTMDFRTGLRRPGMMFMNAVNQKECTEEPPFWKKAAVAIGGALLSGLVSLIPGGLIIDLVGSFAGQGFKAAGEYYLHKDDKCWYVSGRYVVPQPNDPTLCLHMPTSLMDMIKMIQMQTYETDSGWWSENVGSAAAVHYTNGADGPGTSQDDHLDAKISYRTPLIQRGARTSQPSYRIPDIVEEPGHAGYGARLGMSLQDRDPDENEILGAMAKLLLFPYEIGDFQTNSYSDEGLDEFCGDDDQCDETVIRRYSIPGSQQWGGALEDDFDVDFSSGGLYTSAKIGEEWTAIFGGHLYWALQYYKKGLWETHAEFISGETGTVITSPSPLGIFTKDSEGTSNVIKIKGSIPEDLKSISDMDLTGDDGFADVSYGLRLSYLVPPNVASEDPRDYPLSPGKDQLQTSDERSATFWPAVEKATTPMFSSKPFFHDTGEYRTKSTELISHVMDGWDSMKREKSIFISEVPEAVPSINLSDQDERPQSAGFDPFGNLLVEHSRSKYNIGKPIVILPIMEYEDPVGPGKKWNDIIYTEEIFTSLYEGLKVMPDFKLFFEYVIPLKRVVMMLAIRDMLNFESSLSELPYKTALFEASRGDIFNLVRYAFDASKDPRIVSPPAQSIIALQGFKDQFDSLNLIDTSGDS